MSGAFEIGAEHVFSLLWDSPVKGFPYCLLSSGDWPPCHHHAASLPEALLFPSAERFLSVWSEEEGRTRKIRPSSVCVLFVMFCCPVWVGARSALAFELEIKIMTSFLLPGLQSQ